MNKVSRAVVCWLVAFGAGNTTLFASADDGARILVEVPVASLEECVKVGKLIVETLRDETDIDHRLLGTRFAPVVCVPGRDEHVDDVMEKLREQDDIELGIMRALPDAGVELYR